MAVLAIPGPGDILDQVNPWAYIVEGLDHLLHNVAVANNSAIAKPLIPTSGSTIDKIYGESLGTLSWWPYVVMIIIMLAIFIPRFRTNLLEAILVGILIAGLTTTSYQFWDLLAQDRTSWVNLIRSDEVFGPGNGIDVIFGKEPISALVILPIMLYYTIGLLIYLFLEALGIIAAKVVTPIALMLWPTGERGKQLASWVVAVGLLSSLLGPLTAAVIMKVGSVVEHSFKDLTGLFEDIIYIVAVRTAMKSQRTLYEGLKRIAYVRMIGTLSGRSLVGGEVNATSRQALDVNVRRQASQNHGRTMPVPVVIASSSGAAVSRKRRAGRAITREGMIAASAAAGAKLAANTTPVGRIGHQVTQAVHTAQVAKRKRGGQRA